MLKAGDQVRYQQGINAAFHTDDRPDCRDMIGRAVAVQDAGMGLARMPLVIEWSNGIDRVGCPTAWFDAAE